MAGEQARSARGPEGGGGLLVRHWITGQSFVYAPTCQDHPIAVNDHLFCDAFKSISCAPRTRRPPICNACASRYGQRPSKCFTFSWWEIFPIKHSVWDSAAPKPCRMSPWAGQKSVSIEFPYLGLKLCTQVPTYLDRTWMGSA